MAATTLSLGQTSKNADNILKQVKLAENRNMNNEVTIEELDKNLKEANKMKRDAEYKLEELSRRLGVMEVIFCFVLILTQFSHNVLFMIRRS